jgi:SAM-dependent methyltransferase
MRAGHPRSDTMTHESDDCDAWFEPCPVCSSTDTQRFMEIDGLRYGRCPRCQARFLDSRQYPSPRNEYAHYLKHHNDPHNPGYREFLSRLARPLLEQLADSSSGLDFGCGPGPALAVMLREAGHDVALYDPFFQPDTGALQRTYDFITCSETIEHFHHPAAMFERLVALLRPGGRLALMTCFQTDDSRFAHWHYRRDPTHVVFYREATIRHVAALHGLACEIPDKDIALLRKPDTAHR